MADCLYLVRDPRGRVLPESVGATQGHAVCRFATAVAGPVSYTHLTLPTKA